MILSNIEPGMTLQRYGAKYVVTVTLAKSCEKDNNNANPVVINM